MTVGTAIVVSVAIICVTFLGVVIIGANLAKKKTDAAAKLTNELTNHISKKIEDNLNKR